jgi:serine acetyltransferase
LGIPEKQTRQGFVEYLKEQGCTIGERVVFFDPQSTTVDTTRPWLIDIGDDVQIPYGVSILTHGYDWSVPKGKYGDVLGSSGKVKIGNNVFVGAKSIIQKALRYDVTYQRLCSNEPLFDSMQDFLDAVK